jgi:hypothetical protein
MKYFFNKSSFFLIPILLVWMGLEIFYRTTPNNYSVKAREVQKHYQSCEVLILGNSHAYYGLNPEFFQIPTYNFANISQNLYFDKLLFDKHIHNFKKLKWVILNIEYTTLSHTDDIEGETWRKYFYQSQMGIEVDLIPFYDVRQYSLSVSRPLKNSLNTIEQYIEKQTLVDCNESGWGYSYTNENSSTNMEYVAEIVTKKHEDHSLDFSQNLNKIEAIIEQCKQRNIQVLLISMPVYKTYAERVNSHKVSKIHQSAEKVAKKYDNVFYLNLFSDTTFMDSDFFDPDHLNHQGAKKCTQIVNAFMNQNN